MIRSGRTFHGQWDRRERAGIHCAADDAIPVRAVAWIWAGPVSFTPVIVGRIDRGCQLVDEPATERRLAIAENIVSRKDCILRSR
jgi:hypothetical protein